MAAPSDVSLYAAEFLSESLEHISRSNFIGDLHSTVSTRTELPQASREHSGLYKNSGLHRNSELQSTLAPGTKERSGPIPSSPPASLWCSLNARTHSFYAPSTLFTRVQLFICGSNVMFGAQVESRGSSGLIPTRCRQSALQNRTRTGRYT